MTFQAVIFDMDGVIIDSEPIQLARQKEFIAHKNIDIPEEEMLKVVGANRKLTYQIIAPYAPEETFDAYFQGFTDYFEGQTIDFQSILSKEILTVFDWLKKNDKKIALASSGSPEKIATVLKECGLVGYFDVVLSGDQFKQSKPHPEIYFTTAEKLALPVEACIVVEDSEYGITAAKRAGMYTFAKKETRFNFSQAGADQLFTEFDELQLALEKQN